MSGAIEESDEWQWAWHHEQDLARRYEEEIYHGNGIYEGDKEEIEAETRSGWAEWVRENHSSPANYEGAWGPHCSHRYGARVRQLVLDGF